MSKIFNFRGQDAHEACLRNYCLYEFNGSKIFNDAIKMLKSLPFGNKLVEDCVLVGQLSTDPKSIGEQNIRQFLRDEFNKRVDRLDPLPQGSPDAQSQPAPIFVAVSDSEPDPDVDGSLASDVLLPHGPVMRGIIKDLTCPGWSSAIGHTGACPGVVLPVLALPQITNNKASDRTGGKFGTRVEIAQAIYRSVEQWKNSVLGGAGPPQLNVAPRRFVINLSLGWEPSIDCNIDLETACSNRLFDIDNSLVATCAVYDAIKHADCYGGLVIAAAGNDPGNFPDARPGMTCPAAWMFQRRPTADMCSSCEGKGYASEVQSKLGEAPLLPPDDPFGDGDHPLLYAATGVDYADRIVTNARYGSKSKLAALGIFGTAGVGPLPQLHTGTSVACAVTSAAAAAAWAYAPQMTAPEIMEIVYAAGTALPLAPLDDKPPQLSNGHFPPLGQQREPIHRVDVCATIQKICTATNPPPLACKGFAGCPGPLNAGGAQNPSLAPRRDDLISLFSRAVNGGSLDPLSLGTFTPSQKFQAFSTPPQAEVDPAPGNSCGCSTCLVDKNNLYVKIEQSLNIKDLVLTLKTLETRWSGKVSLARAENLYTYSFTSPFPFNSVQTAMLSCSVGANGVLTSGTEQIPIDR